MENQWKDGLGKDVVSIGQRIQVLRNKYNMSKDEFAQLLNITQKTLYNIEHDITEPRVSVLIDLSDYFKISIDSIIKGK